MSIRPVKRIVESKPTMEGAGVKLRRAFGFGNTSEFDPFLLFDDFRNDKPDDYSAGFRRRDHGPGGRAGHPVSAGVRQADRGAGGMVRPDRDEHRRGAAPGNLRPARWHVHREELV